MANRNGKLKPGLFSYIPTSLYNFEFNNKNNKIFTSETKLSGPAFNSTTNDLTSQDTTITKDKTDNEVDN